jgi:alpha-galactosidase
MRKYLSLIILFTGLQVFAQKFDLAKTPPMGWNSWNTFACDINEKLIQSMADAMVTSGMRDAGYVYLNIDDCWHGARDAQGFIHEDPTRFPSGMKSLVDYIHSKGLKVGIYSDAGTQTCGGRPGSRGHEYQDAITYAQWGIDYLKYDWCNTEGLKADEAYKTMRDALYSAGRPVVFSICEWGDNKPWNWAIPIGHLWRTTGDITNCWNCEQGFGTWSKLGVLNILDKQADLRKYAGPGHWNDPDMLEVGNGLSEIENKAHFSLWCMLAAPLMAGNDLRNMSAETKEILTNKDAIAINQDVLGVQCFKLLDEGDFEVYAKPLDKGELAICFLNRGENLKKISFNWKNYSFTDGLCTKTYDFGKTKYSIRNCWQKVANENTDKAFLAELQAHDVVLLRLIPENN